VLWVLSQVLYSIFSLTVRSLRYNEFFHRERRRGPEPAFSYEPLAFSESLNKDWDLAVSPLLTDSPNVCYNANCFDRERHREEDSLSLDSW